jgi:TatA/E family protein of Tat protein translocase
VFGIGPTELIIILVLALIVIGPKKLPDLAKALGKGMAEFKKASREIKESLDLDEDFQDVKKDLVDSVSELNEPYDFEEPKKEEEVTQDTDIDKAPTSDEGPEKETEPSEETTEEPSEETKKNG